LALSAQIKEEFPGNFGYVKSKLSLRFLCCASDGDQHHILGDGDICQLRRLDAEKLTALPANYILG